MSRKSSYVPRHRGGSAQAVRRSVAQSSRYVPRHGAVSRRSREFTVRSFRATPGRHARPRPPAVSRVNVVVVAVLVMLLIPAVASLTGPSVRAAMGGSSSGQVTTGALTAPSPVVVLSEPVPAPSASLAAAPVPARSPSPVPTVAPSVASTAPDQSVPSPTPEPTLTVLAEPSSDSSTPSAPEVSESPAVPAPRSPTVPLAVVGDSIAVMVAEAWDGQVPVVEAQVGISSRASAEVVVPLLEGLSDPGVTVVALGTNDDAGSSAAFGETVRRVVAAAPGCVAWLTVHRSAGGQTWSAFNDVLRASARDFRRLVLVDWDEIALTNPDAVYPDGIHPTPAGVSQIAAEVSQAAAKCPVPARE